jgi:hypothetical protein
LNPTYGNTRRDATDRHPPAANTVFPEEDAVQFIPSEEYATLFNPKPPATHKDPFHPTDLHRVVSILVPFEDAVQVSPSKEYANKPLPLLFWFVPPATHIDPFHATELQVAGNVAPKTAFPFVEAFQVIPSEEYANTFVP